MPMVAYDPSQLFAFLDSCHANVPGNYRKPTWVLTRIVGSISPICGVEGYADDDRPMPIVFNVVRCVVIEPVFTG